MVIGRSPKRIRRRQRGFQQQERRTKANEGKGKGSSTEPPETNIADDISNDGSHLDLICGIFQSYNDLALAGSSNMDFCRAFETDNSLLCPNEYELGKICDGIQAGLALKASITENYCAPIFDEVHFDAFMMVDCAGFCVSFVDEGDCCDLSCS